LEKPLEELGGLKKSELTDCHRFFKKGVCKFYLVCILSEGAIFGELAFLLKKRRSASIVCSEDCSFAVLKKYDYLRIISRIDEKLHMDKVRFFH